MEFSKNGFVCRVAYFWTSPGCCPRQTSICKLFWKFVWNLFIGIPVGVLVIVVIALVFLLGVTVILFLFGYRFKWGKEWSMEDIFIPFRHWPKIRGHRIWPAPFLAAGCIIWLVVQNVETIGRWGSGTGEFFSVLASASVLSWTVAVLVTAAAAVWALRSWRKSEARRMFREWRRAAHQKICPLVTLVDNPVEPTGGPN